MFLVIMLTRFIDKEVATEKKTSIYMIICVFNIATMRFLIIFFLVIICTQGNATPYQCDMTASCGCSGPSTVLGRIVGGEPATQGSWSWTVSLRKNGSHICGASILSSLFIITAAHCVENSTDAKNFSIVAGSINVEPNLLKYVQLLKSTNILTMIQKGIQMILHFFVYQLH
jgi:Trypsin